MTTSSENASALCVSCGLCCNGALFTNAKAEPEEVPLLRALGLEVAQAGDRLQFGLPCRYNVEGCCTIYDQRFTKCRTFRCALLKRLDTGEVSLPEALETVGKAKRMLDALVAIDPEAGLAAVRAARRRLGPPRAADAGSARKARLWIDSLALDMFLDRAFRNRKTVDFQTSAAATEPELPDGAGPPPDPAPETSLD